MDKHKQADWGNDTNENSQQFNGWIIMIFVMRPFGSTIKYDTHSWDQTEDVAGSMFRLSSRVRLRLALSQTSQPPHA